MRISKNGKKKIIINKKKHLRENIIFKRFFISQSEREKGREWENCVWENDYTVESAGERMREKQKEK